VALLRISGLSKLFGGTIAVNQVDLDVDAGELTAIIGPNGAGKSTLLNLMSGHVRPSAGRIIFEERMVNGLSRHCMCRLGIGRNFQQPNFFPNLAVIENVQVPLIRSAGFHRRVWGDAGRARIEEAEQLLQAVGLDVARDLPAGLLSYGDQRRLEIAIALGSRPRLLLLDEPTAGMSKSERRVLTELIARLNREHGVTVLFTEHDMDVVFSVARRIHVLHQGTILASGAPEQVKANREVRRVYLGEDF
jgi:branched-chain amino acid transport system ATP-binding protein